MQCLLSYYIHNQYYTEFIPGIVVNFFLAVIDFGKRFAYCVATIRNNVYAK